MGERDDHDQYSRAKLYIMLEIKQKNKVTRGGAILERVAREGRCKETGAEARMEQGVSHADLSFTPSTCVHRPTNHHGLPSLHAVAVGAPPPPAETEPFCAQLEHHVFCEAP